MYRDAQQTLFLFPPMPLSSRMLVFEFGQFLIQTGTEYEQHFKMELTLCRQAARLDLKIPCEESMDGCKILLFDPHYKQRGLSSSK